jgi:hypothetical protein
MMETSAVGIGSGTARAASFGCEDVAAAAGKADKMANAIMMSFFMGTSLSGQRNVPTMGITFGSAAVSNYLKTRRFAPSRRREFALSRDLFLLSIKTPAW